MRARSLIVLGLLFLVVVRNYAHSAEPPPPQYPGPFPVELKVGEIFVANNAPGIVRPAKMPICDDLKIVNVVDTPDGLAFKGIAPGKTLCSVASGTTMSGGLGRRVFTITVLPE